MSSSKKNIPLTITSLKNLLNIKTIHKTNQKNYDDKLKKKQVDHRLYLKNNNFFSYYSNGPSHNFNCKFKRADNSLIVCRHISYKVALTGINGYQSFISNPQSFIDKFQINLFDEKRISFKSTYYNLLEKQSLGHHLKSIAEAIDYGEECTLLLSSENHMMALNIKNSLKEEQGYITIKFYDPNITGRHKKILFKNIDDVETIKIEDFIIKDWVNKYFPDHDLIQLTSLKMRQEESEPVILVDANLTIKSKLLFSLFNGWEELVSHSLEQIKNNEIEVLKAVTAQGVPALNFAMQNNNTKAVEVYVRNIANRKLSQAEKLLLLSAKRKDETPGLYLTMFGGFTNTMSVFIQAILDAANIDYAIKLKLIAAKDHKNAPGLYIAFQVGNSDLIKRYMEIILTSNLINYKDKLQLIAAKDGQTKTYGLCLALALGHSDTVSVYVTLILNSEIIQYKDKIILLKGVNGHEKSGLLRAITDGHTSSVLNYITLILESKLNLEDKLSLVAPDLGIENGGLKDILKFAWQMKHVEMVRNYKTTLLHSELKEVPIIEELVKFINQLESFKPSESSYPLVFFSNNTPTTSISTHKNSNFEIS